VSTPVEPVLRAEGLSAAFGPRKLFSGLSLQLPPGVTLVRGGDGRGKTTLLELLAGLTPPRTGTLRIGSLDLATHADAYRAQVFLTRPATAALDGTTPADWFDGLGQRYRSGFNARGDRRTGRGPGLGPHLEKPGYMLSAGTKRKVWLAGAFASGAAVTLLDEPFAALDKASIGFVLELLDDAAARFGARLGRGRLRSATRRAAGGRRWIWATEPSPDARAQPASADCVWKRQVSSHICSRLQRASQPRMRRASSALAQNAGRSPARRGAKRWAIVRPLACSKARTISSTLWPWPEPRFSVRQPGASPGAARR
jgi:ABC-type transport system involved in cytochrome c biogenesis ATPase subunit